MRRWIALLMLVIFLLGASGCTGRNSDGKETVQTISSVQTAASDRTPDSSGSPAPAPLSDFYGAYTFKEVSVLSMLSSSTIDWINERKAGSTYTITEELFEVRSDGNVFSAENPRYEECAVPEEYDGLNRDLLTLAGTYLIDAQYRVLTENGEKTYHKLYTSSAYPDLIWISGYADNTADGSEILVQDIDLLVREAS